MDLREIQALHEQYASQPVVIDITGHTKAMPALPAPTRSTTDRPWTARVMSRCRRLAKPTAIAVAVAMAASAAGVSTAKLWRVMHTPAHHAAAANVAPQPLRADVTPSASSAPAPALHPLTSAELDGDSHSPDGPMATTDPRELTARQSAAPAATPPAAPAQVSDTEKAAASPIHAPRRSAPSPEPIAQPQATNAASAAPVAPVAPAATAARLDATPPAAPAARQPQAAANQSPARSPANPETVEPRQPPRPVHHSPPRRHVAPAPQPETAAPAPAPSPTAKAPAATKSGDVQLF